MSTEVSATNCFKKQFSNGDHKESFVVQTEEKSLTDFSKLNLDIGWVLDKGNKKKLKHSTVRTKTCLGVVRCNNKICPFFKKDMSPKYTRELINKQQCIHCKESMSHELCFVKVKYTLQYDVEIDNVTCTVECQGQHRHDSYHRKHLSGNAKQQLLEKIKQDPMTTPKKMTVGISSRTGEVVGAAREIDPILSNKDRTKYEIAKAKQVLGISKTTDFLGEFCKIQAEFQGYITFAQVATEKSFLVTFMPPDVNQYHISFGKHPIVTDVTYKAISDNKKYLCSSCVYVPHWRRNMVIFQAIIGGLEASNFAEYFIQLFKQLKLNKHQFLGMIMDFSAAQRLGFIHAFNFIYNNSADGSGTAQQMSEALSYLKGCYMHWMQSVQRMVSNHTVVSPDSRPEFLQLVHRLRTTDSSVVFVDSVLQLSVTFPNCRRWLSWWLQPSVSSMVFSYGSKMKTALANHPMRTSNSIESFHGVLYSTINPKTPMPEATRQLLQVLKDGLDSLKVYFDLGITPGYGSKERQKQSRRIVNYYKESDSRAPDNTEALLGDSNSQVNKKKRKQEEADSQYFENIKMSSQQRRKIVEEEIAGDSNQTAADATALANEDLETAFGRVIKSEQDLVREDVVKKAAFYKSLANRADDTAEDINEEVPKQLQSLLHDPEEKHDDPSSPESADSDAFSFDLTADDIMMLDNLVDKNSKLKEVAPLRHELLLNPNNSNSCYIDGPIELLLRCIFPYIKKSLLVQHDSENQFDAVLVDAFRHYEQGNSMAGNQLVREFVWQHDDKLFIKGQMNDAHALLSWILENVSPRLRSLLALENAYRLNLCKHDEDDMFVENTKLQPLPFITNFPTMKQYVSVKKIKDKTKQEAEMARLDELFCQSFAQLLHCVKEDATCGRCHQMHAATNINLITEESLPPFLLITDPTNFVWSNLNAVGDLKEKDCQPYFPLTITFNAPLPVEYTLHARLYSWYPQGGHFYAVGKVVNDKDVEGNYKIGNLKRSCQELVPGSGYNPMQKATNSIVVCYKKKSIKTFHFFSIIYN